MLKCEGYKMFKGKMRIMPKCANVQPFEIEATWLYKPESNCWYGNGSSFMAEICEIVEDCGVV